MEREELERLNSYNPFGRSGAGAPIRDNYGNIITTRKTIANDSMHRVQSSYKENNMPNNIDNSYDNDRSPEKGNVYRTDQNDHSDRVQSYNNPYDYSGSKNRVISGRNEGGYKPDGFSFRDQYFSHHGGVGALHTPQHINNKHFYNYNDYFDVRNTDKFRTPSLPQSGIQRSTPNIHNSNYNGNAGRQSPNRDISQDRQHYNRVHTVNQPEDEQISTKKDNYRTILMQQIEDKRNRDIMLRKQERETDKREEEKYYQFL
jgi:hypothetical protein